MTSVPRSHAMHGVDGFESRSVCPGVHANSTHAPKLPEARWCPDGHFVQGVLELLSSSMRPEGQRGHAPNVPEGAKDPGGHGKQDVAGFRSSSDEPAEHAGQVPFRPLDGTSVPRSHATHGDEASESKSVEPALHLNDAHDPLLPTGT